MNSMNAMSSIKLGTVSRFFTRVAVLAGLSGMLFLAGCASNKPKEELEPSGGGVATAPSADENITLGDSDSDKAAGLQTVHFPYDSFLFDAQAKSVLSANAAILKGKPNFKIQIEGHCDQRGGIQYNIALGEKRANATRKYLEDLGVSSDRMTVISFGKEKPIDAGSSEESYSKNRRSNFVITSH